MIDNLNLKQLRVLHPNEFAEIDLTTEDIITIFEKCDASWIHNGDPKMPHAELTSGKCSNAFFDCWRVLKYYNLSEILANQLARKIRSVIGSSPVDVVTGSPYAGITFAHDVGRALGASEFAFTVKDPDDQNKKRMKFDRERILEGAGVMQIEELVTTSLTTNEVQKAIDVAHPHTVRWLPFIGMLVHRPPQMTDNYGGRKIIALVEQEVWAVDPDDCELCKAGSPRYRPKQNWGLLTGKKQL